MKKKKIILVIGGHDPTGGAGIVADIETAANFKLHALSILTCTTIQNRNKMIKIGITGSLASGKTTASQILSYGRGPLFSADQVVKKLYKNNF